MKNLDLADATQLHPIEILFTDIDDTITTDGQISSTAFESLWKLHKAGIKVVPVTGRPAGWCELIARMWPVSGVIGENGAFYFRYDTKRMHRWFAQPEAIRQQNQNKLIKIREQVLSEVPGSDVASDQFCRMFDLAIDFCEDVVPLPDQKIQKIVQIFKAHGAQAKVSSIHVNGWFGEHDKLSTARIFLENELQLKFEASQSLIAFCGDSPNDEPMFAAFKNSFGVANVGRFKDQLKFLPTYICKHHSGEGFTELAEVLIAAKTSKK